MGGNLADKDALRAAIEAADFRSVRGNFKFGANHYPVQDFWLCKVAARADGKFQTETVRKVLENDVDPWAAECRMPARVESRRPPRVRGAHGCGGRCRLDRVGGASRRT